MSVRRRRSFAGGGPQVSVNSEFCLVYALPLPRFSASLLPRVCLITASFLPHFCLVSACRSSNSAGACLGDFPATLLARRSPSGLRLDRPSPRAQVPTYPCFQHHPTAECEASWSKCCLDPWMPPFCPTTLHPAGPSILFDPSYSSMYLILPSSCHAHAQRRSCPPFLAS